MTGRLLLLIQIFWVHALFAQTNLALNKPITATGTLGANAPSLAVDGNGGTRWESPHGVDNQTLQIDLGEVYDLSAMKVIWEGASAKSYEVYISGNSNTWTKVGEKTSNVGARTDDLIFGTEAKEARYVRLNLLTRNTVYGFSIYEIEINGSLSTVTPIATSMTVQPKEVNLLASLPSTYKILSINNSLIDYNDQYLVFNQLASSAGKNVTWTKQTRLGQSLRWHFEEGEGTTANGATAKLTVRSQAWTHIILQEQSDKPLTDAADFRESVILWKNYIKNNCPNPNAKIILAMNWAYVDATDFSQKTSTLYATYMSIAKELGISVCPIGNAYEAIRQAEGETAKNALYSDNRHPTALATYLASCMQYASLFDQTPIGLTYRPSAVSASDATRMQNYAWSNYQAHDDVVNDVAGIVRFSYVSLDQFNRKMSTGAAAIWNVNTGGTINSNGIFSKSSIQEATLNVSASTGAFSDNATLKLVNAVTLVAEQFAELSTTNNYTQDFNSMGTDAIATLPSGWKIEKRLDAPRTLGSYASASNKTEQVGGNGMASNATNGLYNFGAGVANSATDRAIGGISTSVASGTRGINIYLQIKNTGTASIPALAIAYDVEKYRKGNNAAGFTMQLYYSTDGEIWTSAGSNFLTTFNADTETAGYTTAPSESKSISATLNQSIAANASLYLAWNYAVTSGTDAAGAQALGLDNVSIKNSTANATVDYASLTATSSYQQNFDAIGNTNTATLPLGWKIEKRIDAPRTLGNYSTASSQTEQIGGNSIASNATNGIYNFGAGVAASASDRAIGGISTGIANGTRCINTYLKIKNTGNTDISSINIAYDVEKYRKGANSAGFRVQLYYSNDGVTWLSAANSFTTTFSADAATEGYTNAPGDTRNVNATLAYPLSPDQILYLAWNISLVTGTDPQMAQALGIDNVVIQNNAVLPLNFVSFTAKTNGLAQKHTLLNWTTEQEVNTDKFEIERSEDNHFEKIGTVTAHHTSGTAYYSFTDTQPLHGISFYRIKQIDKDGKYTYSETKSIKNDHFPFSIYPNPAADRITIQVPKSLEGGKIIIYNHTGQKVYRKENIVSSENVDISKLPTGFYLIEAINHQQKEILKLIKK